MIWLILETKHFMDDDAVFISEMWVHLQQTSAVTASEETLTDTVSSPSALGDAVSLMMKSL